ncbi:MAG TPA: tRNA (guanosine(46)-N7)-methyltransferase TrmB [Pseudohaliea sp.]|nr:tRNA (guanosine(46)-N7)-methyltransferase TrmB [Pseudohaliea sp.]
MTETPREQRPIRSFVLRHGRMTTAQRRAYAAGWERFGVDFTGRPLAFDALFGRPGPRVLEIGFGMGHSLAEMAAAAPDRNFLGIEVHRPGVGKLLHLVQEQGLTNVRVLCHDAVEVLGDGIAPGSLDTLQIFFPDPWHKKRHHKRRLIQPAFVALAASRLRPGGLLHLATDWENYAEQMLEVLSACPALENTVAGGGYAPRPGSRPLTKFEQRGERLGHGVRDLVFQRG